MKLKTHIKNQRGMGLAEVLIAAGLVVLTALSVSYYIVQSKGTGIKVSGSSECTNIAQDVLSRYTAGYLDKSNPTTPLFSLGQTTSRPLTIMGMYTDANGIATGPAAGANPYPKKDDYVTPLSNVDGALPLLKTVPPAGPDDYNLFQAINNSVTKSFRWYNRDSAVCQDHIDGSGMTNPGVDITSNTEFKDIWNPTKILFSVDKVFFKIDALDVSTGNTLAGVACGGDNYRPRPNSTSGFRLTTRINYKDKDTGGIKTCTASAMLSYSPDTKNNSTFVTRVTAGGGWPIGNILCGPDGSASLSPVITIDGNFEPGFVLLCSYGGRPFDFCHNYNTGIGIATLKVVPDKNGAAAHAEWYLPAHGEGVGYSFAIKTVDTAGNESPVIASSFSVDLHRPHPTMPQPSDPNVIGPATTVGLDRVPVIGFSSYFLASETFQCSAATAGFGFNFSMGDTMIANERCQVDTVSQTPMPGPDVGCSPGFAGPIPNLGNTTDKPNQFIVEAEDDCEDHFILSPTYTWYYEPNTPAPFVTSPSTFNSSGPPNRYSVTTPNEKGLPLVVACTDPQHVSDGSAAANCNPSWNPGTNSACRTPDPGDNTTGLCAEVVNGCGRPVSTVSQTFQVEGQAGQDCSSVPCDPSLNLFCNKSNICQTKSSFSLLPSNDPGKTCLTNADCQGLDGNGTCVGVVTTSGLCNDSTNFALNPYNFGDCKPPAALGASCTCWPSPTQNGPCSCSKIWSQTPGTCAAPANSTGNGLRTEQICKNLPPTGGTCASRTGGGGCACSSTTYIGSTCTDTNGASCPGTLPTPTPCNCASPGVVSAINTAAGQTCSGTTGDQDFTCADGTSVTCSVTGTLNSNCGSEASQNCGTYPAPNGCGTCSGTAVPKTCSDPDIVDQIEGTCTPETGGAPIALSCGGNPTGETCPGAKCCGCPTPVSPTCYYTCNGPRYSAIKFQCYVHKPGQFDPKRIYWNAERGVKNCPREGANCLSYGDPNVSVVGDMYVMNVTGGGSCVPDRDAMDDYFKSWCNGHLPGRSNLGGWRDDVHGGTGLVTIPPDPNQAKVACACSIIPQPIYNSCASTGPTGPGGNPNKINGQIP